MRIFQSTLLQEERLHTTLQFRDKTIISIHAPTRGATFPAGVVLTLPEIISIHAPTRGATFYNRDVCRQGEISIHAPTRGATAKMHNYPYTYL